jgi:transcriptional regulator with XRE-family HTH domain
MNGLIDEYITPRYINRVMSEIFAERLKQALQNRGWSQAELATKIGLTQPAVSQFVSGKREPSQRVLADIAEALELSAAALLGQTTTLADVLTDSASDMSWHEREVYPDGARSYGNVRVETLSTSLATLVREAAQNSNDAACEDASVEMEFRLGILSGERLEAFQSSIQWSTLLPHIKAVAADHEHRSTKRFRQGLEVLEASKQLVVLRIDDYGTVGLIGDDYKKGNFSALVRRSQDTQKEHGTSAGGRFGLGAGIFSACSAFDTLLFSSKLSQPVQGLSDRRLIGRAVFPFHEIGISEFEGPFFYGIDDPGEEKRRLSAWATEQQTERLWLTRSNDKTGTSILIVGFFDPEQGIDVEADFTKLPRRLADEFTHYFWPAITRGRISAVFSRYENDEEIDRYVVDGNNVDHPYAKLLAGGNDILEQTVPLHVPRSKETHDGPYDHNAKLYIEVLPPEALNVRQINEVAICRRPLMVVRYISLPHLTLGARNFRAMVIAGEAAADDGMPTAADLAAETFLAKAEPAEHDQWTSRGTDLVAEYHGGSKSLSDFFEKIKSQIKRLIAPERDSDNKGPRALRELLALPGTTPTPKPRAYVSSPVWEDPGTYHRLAAIVKLTVRANDDVAFRPRLAIATESGGALPLAFKIIKHDGATFTDDGILKPNPGVRQINIVLEPDWGSVPARPALSAVTLDMSVEEKVRS